MNIKSRISDIERLGRASLTAGLAGAILCIASTVWAQNYQTVLPNLTISGDGSQTSNFATNAKVTPAMNAALQVSRNTSGSGNEQGGALDLYAGQHGTNLRVWMDSPSYTGGRVPALTIDNGGGLSLRTSEVISGMVGTFSGNPYNAVVLAPTTDPAMLALWSDVNAPALVVAPNYTSGTPGQGNFQNAVFLDGRKKERLAIDGDGTLQWSPPVSNTFANSSWDTTLTRVAPGVLSTQGMQVTAMLVNAPYTFNTLPSIASVPDGTQVYCQDCIFQSTTNPCSGGGTGAMAFVIGGVWQCD